MKSMKSKLGVLLMQVQYLTLPLLRLVHFYQVLICMKQIREPGMPS